MNCSSPSDPTACFGALGELLAYAEQECTDRCGSPTMGGPSPICGFRDRIATAALPLLKMYDATGELQSSTVFWASYSGFKSTLCSGAAISPIQTFFGKVGPVNSLVSR